MTRENMEGSPEKTDRAITNPFEEALFSFQIAKKLIEEDIAKGKRVTENRHALETLNQIISLSERITRENDPQEKKKLLSEIKILQDEIEPIMESLANDAILDDIARSEEKKMGL